MDTGNLFGLLTLAIGILPFLPVVCALVWLAQKLR